MQSGVLAWCAGTTGSVPEAGYLLCQHSFIFQGSLWAHCLSHVATLQPN